MELSDDMKKVLQIDSPHIVLGVGLFNNRIPATNFKLRKEKFINGHYMGFQVEGYFTPHNVIGLCGRALWDGKIIDTCHESHWCGVLSHEFLHFLLFKYIGNDANRKFDNINIWEYCGVEDEEEFKFEY